jgi:hypothetical protein
MLETPGNFADLMIRLVHDYHYHHRVHPSISGWRTQIYRLPLLRSWCCYTKWPEHVRTLELMQGHS